MALPATFDTLTVKGSYLDFLGLPPADGSTIDFEPNVSALKHNSSDTIIFSAKRSVTLAADGTFSIVLPVTTDPDVTPTFQYNVTENIKGAATRKYVVDFPVALAGTTVDLSDYVVIGAAPAGTNALTKAAADALYASVSAGTTGTGLDAESARDTIAAALRAAGYIGLTSDDAGDTITIGTNTALDAFLSTLAGRVTTLEGMTVGTAATTGDVPAGAPAGTIWLIP